MSITALHVTTLKDLIEDCTSDIVLDRYGDFVTDADTADGHCAFEDLDYWPTLEEVRAQLTAGGYQKLYEMTIDGRTEEGWCDGKLLEKSI